MDTCVLRNVYEILRYHHWSTWSKIKVGVKKFDAHYIKLGGPFSLEKPFNLHIICHYSNSAYNAHFIYLIFISLNLVSQHKRKRKVFHYIISFLRPNSLLYFILKYSQLVMGNLAHSKNSATITTLEYVVSLNKQNNKNNNNDSYIFDGRSTDYTELYRENSEWQHLKEFPKTILM